MQNGDSARLISDAISGKRILYAKAGVKVKIICIAAPAAIVEDEKQNRFPTTIKNLSKLK